jgi:hypothetical protein
MCGPELILAKYTVHLYFYFCVKSEVKNISSAQNVCQYDFEVLELPIIPQWREWYNGFLSRKRQFELLHYHVK